jgi:Ran GTPase-activating protein (RanGAP) involved in mRNA processing and transport
MEEFLHLYEMESLSLGITARRDVVDQVRRFFLGDAGATSGLYRTALALASRHEHKKDAKNGEDEDANEPHKTLRLVVAGNSKECFRNRLRNIQLVALSNAVVKSRLVGITSLNFAHNYLGEEQRDGTSTIQANERPGSMGGANDVNGIVLDETPFLLDAAPALARLLVTTAAYASEIEELHLGGNRIGPESCKLLCSALTQHAAPLRWLDLSGNPLRVAGGHAVADLLAHAQCPLVYLNVGNTELEIENVIAIATALRENTTLVEIHLDKPIVRTKEEEAVQHIGKMLQVNETLRVLSLNKHQLSDHGAQVLAERMLDNHSLERLTLRANSIGATGAAALAALLLRHDALAELDLSANRIGDAGAEAFAKLLRHNTRPLSTLALCSTYLTDDGLAAIARACLAPRHAESNRLQNLLLWGNDFGTTSSALFLELHRGRFADWNVETDFLPVPTDDDEGDVPSVQIAHREVQRAAAFASPKR